MAQQVEGRDTSAARTPARPLWFMLSAWVLTLAGLGISIYLTISHYDEKALVCSASGTVDCHAVTTSKYSELAGIPLPLLGLGFFVGFVVLITPFALRSENPLFRWGRLAATGIGMVFVIYLVTVELALLQKICLWCTGVHAVTVLLFVLVLSDEFRRIGQVD